jgi:hypothetical protein
VFALSSSGIRIWDSVPYRERYKERPQASDSTGTATSDPSLAASSATTESATYRAALALAYLRQRRSADAELLFRDLLTERRQSHGTNSVEAAETLSSLGLALVNQRKFPEAEAVLRECLAIREAKLPESWTRFNVASLLGGALLGQKKFAEAEPLLLSGYAGMKERESKIPAKNRGNFKASLSRLVQLYTDWAKPEQAAEWKKKLAEFDQAHPAQPPAATK